MNPHETLREALACVGLCAIVFCLLVRCSEAQELTPRDLALNEARAAVTDTPFDAVRCYQARTYANTAPAAPDGIQPGPAEVCVTEAQWRRMHADEVAAHGR